MGKKIFLAPRIQSWVIGSCTFFYACNAPYKAGAAISLAPFIKHPSSILAPIGDSWESKDVFNPTAWTDGKTIFLLYRAEDHSIDEKKGISRIGIATSTDGVNFHREKTPILFPTELYEDPYGCEDPRVIFSTMAHHFYMTYTAYDGKSARLALASSPDLHTWKKHGVMFPHLPWSKSGAMIAEKIQGKYWMYFGDKDIHVATTESDDLSDLSKWKIDTTPLISPREGHFDSVLCEPGPAPVITEKGILLIYNGATRDKISGKLHYTVGHVFLDKKNPAHVIYRSETPFLIPDSPDEISGQVDNVIFAEGLVFFKEKWLLYFGMADSKIGVASTTTSALLAE